MPEEISGDWQLLLKGLLTQDPDNGGHGHGWNSGWVVNGYCYAI